LIIDGPEARWVSPDRPHFLYGPNGLGPKKPKYILGLPFEAQPNPKYRLMGRPLARPIFDSSSSIPFDSKQISPQPWNILSIMTCCLPARLRLKNKGLGCSMTCVVSHNQGSLRQFGSPVVILTILILKVLKEKKSNTTLGDKHLRSSYRSNGSNL